MIALHCDGTVKTKVLCSCFCCLTGDFDTCDMDKKSLTSIKEIKDDKFTDNDDGDDKNGDNCIFIPKYHKIEKKLIEWIILC